MKKSVMSHRFDTTPRADIPRSSFDRSHGYKTTFDAGYLIPFYADEALPGDTFNLKVTAFARLATPIKPIMDNMFMETFFFSVPIRQIWENWEKFNGEQELPGDSTDFTVPTVGFIPNAHRGTIYDYMGLPTHSAGVLTVNSLHFRAYNHIFNNWFRNQNLVNSAFVQKDDGPDEPADYFIRRRMKRPDYFTSALPFPQKGDLVTLNIGGQAPIEGIGIRDVSNFTAVDFDMNETDGNTDHYDFAADFGEVNASDIQIKGESVNGDPLIYANLAEATGITVNDLRQSFQIQKLLERDARSGTRYPEIIKSHFGVTDPQMLVLQRPEFLGGGSSRVNISPVQQTSQTDPSGPDMSPQGNLAAFGTVTLNNHGFTKSFTEHCVLIGIVNVRADLTYQEGVNRMWSRQTRFDYYWPVFAGLGEQAILNQEIYLRGITVDDEETFGYQERYAEYRYKPSLITGKFKSDDPETLDIWHLSEQFDSTPVLGTAFIEDDPPIDRIIAVPDEPHFLFDSYIKLRCARPMPLYGVPGLIDHF